MVYRGMKAPAGIGVPKLQAVQAILLLRGHYVLQLRDNRSDIEAPGQWSLFGGRIDTGETPIQAIRREISEELCIAPAEYQFLWFTDYTSCLEKVPVRSWFFTADVSEMWDRHILKEGSDVRAFSFLEISELPIPPVMRETLVRFHEQLKSGPTAR